MKDFIKTARGFLSGTMIRQDWIALACLLGGAALVIAGYVLGVHPKQTQTAKDLEEQNANVVEVLEEALEKSQKIGELEEETVRVEGLVKEFQDRLPTTREMVTLVQNFEKMATSSDVRFDLSSLPKKVEGLKETIPYSVTAIGNFHQLATFINSLELFKRYIKITNLDIGSQVDNEAIATFTLNTYRFLEGSS